MKNSSVKIKILKFLLINILLFYFVFLIIDLFKVHFFMLSKTLKFVSIIMIFFISMMVGGDYVSKKDAFLLKLGVFFTLIADTFLLLLNKNYELGVGFFCIVQILYFIRYSSKGIKDIIPIFSALFFVFISIYYTANFLIIEIDFLLVISSYYAVCLLLSVKKAIYLYKNKSYPKLNHKMIVLGMILFLLCDINVALYNITEFLPGKTSYSMALSQISSFLIWFFYLPSQIFLVLSAYKPSVLKNIFSGKH